MRKRSSFSALRAGRPRLLAAVIAALLLLTAVPLASCGEKDKNVLYVYIYGDYINDEVVKDFENETGIDVVINTFDTVEEMYPVIKNQAAVYDVICASDYMIEKMKNEGLLQKLDKSRIPNAKNISPRFRKMIDESFDPGNRYCVLYQYGVDGIMYNKKRVKDPITSWNDLWKKKYKGRLLMQDGLRDTLAASLKKNGYSLNSTKEAQVKKATNDLIRQKPLVYKYTNDSARDLLINNSADIGVVWSGEVLHCQELNPDLEFVIPKEGTEFFLDCWAIPKAAYHKENAEKFINYMCRGDVAYKNYEYLTYMPPNDLALEKIPESIKSNPSLALPDSALEKSEVLRDIGPDGDELYDRYWKIFKSAS